MATTDVDRHFQRGMGNSAAVLGKMNSIGHHCMSGSYNIGSYMMNRRISNNLPGTSTCLYQGCGNSKIFYLSKDK